MIIEGTQQDLKDWFYKNWYKPTVFLAVYSLLFLFLYVYKSNFLLFLIWLQVPIYWLHEFEEYVLPGGFKDWFNKKWSKVHDADVPLNDASVLWINISIVFILFPLFAALSTIDLKYGMWIPYFSIINGLAHILFAIKLRGYNPGLVVSVLFNVPVGVFVVITILEANVVSIGANITSIIIALLVQVFITTYGVITLKKHRKQTRT